MVLAESQLMQFNLQRLVYLRIKDAVKMKLKVLRFAFVTIIIRKRRKVTCLKHEVWNLSQHKIHNNLTRMLVTNNHYP